MGHGPAKPAAAPPKPVSQDDFAAQFIKEKKELEVDKYFRALVKFSGSDLHMKVGRPPMVRIKGELKPLNRGPIDGEEMTRLLVPLMSDRHRGIFAEEGGADFSHSCDSRRTRFCNYFCNNGFYFDFA